MRNLIATKFGEKVCSKKIRRPAINNDRGTILSIILEFEKGSFRLDPFVYECGGLAFSPKELFRAINFRKDDNKNIASDSILLIDENTEYCELNLLSGFNGRTIRKIKPFIMYPDGSTWTDYLSNDLKDLIGILWSENIIYNLSDKNKISHFFSPTYWWESPALLLIYRTDNIEECPRIEHTCNDCYVLAEPD